jgi:hypothetical protein
VEQYGIAIKEIATIKDASINITCKGIIQITCHQKNLDDCLKWLSEVVKLPPDQKRLVMFPKRIAYRLTDSFKEKSVPSDEMISKIGSIEGAPIVMPLGWEYKFGEELGQNALKGLFSDFEPIILTTNEAGSSSNQHKTDYNRSGVTAEKYLGNKLPIVHLRGKILSPKEEEGLMNMWMKSRSDVWQWFDSGPMKGGRIEGKVLIHDLTINRKTGAYDVYIRPYSDDQLTHVGARKNVTVRLKS